MASVFDQASAGVQKAAQGAVKGAKSFASDFVGKDIAGAASDLFAGDFKGAVGGVKSIATDVVGKDVVGAASDLLSGNFGGALEGAKAMATDFVGADVMGAASDLLSGDFAGAVDGFKGAAESALGVVTGGGVGELVQNVGGDILGAISSEGGALGAFAGLLGGAFAGQQAKLSWGRLNPHLLAQITACDSKGLALASEPDPVIGPITEATIEYAFNWQSPFENTGPESKAPALMAMLQTGQLGTVINALQTVLPDVVMNAAGGMLDEAATKAQEASRALEGRTGITKLNSRQVFSGMPPVKINMTLHLRAMRDPEREINAQYQRLLRWSLPQQLAADSTLTGIIKQTGSTAEMVKALFPSLAPLMIGMVYGGQRFSPMVIESISSPLDAPRYRDGNYVYLPIQITLATLTALDRNDVLKMFI